MWTVLYFIVLVVGLINWSLQLRLTLRRGLIAGIVVTSVALGALPWDFVPVDGLATMVQAGILGLALLCCALRRDLTQVLRNNCSAAMYVLFGACLAILLWFWLPLSDATQYGMQKATLFAFRSLLPILVLSFLGPWQRAELKTVLYALLWAGTLMSLRILAFADPLLERAAFDNLYSIGAARIVGLGMTIAAAQLYFGQVRRLPGQLVLAAILAIGTLAMLQTGSRGPLLSTVFAIIFLTAVLILVHRKRISLFFRSSLITVFLAGLVFTTFLLAPSFTNTAAVDRLTDRLGTLGENLSDIGRLERYVVAVDAFTGTLGLGVGTGGFASIYESASTSGSNPNRILRSYPHNIVLEAAAELGITGVLVVIGLMVVGLSSAIRLLRQFLAPETAALAALTLYVCGNAMVSYDIAGNQDMWIMLALPTFVVISRIPSEAASQRRLHLIAGQAPSPKVAS